jgi:hypothetical protein
MPAASGAMARMRLRRPRALGPVSEAAATAARLGATVASSERPMFHGFMILLER